MKVTIVIKYFMHDPVCEVSLLFVTPNTALWVTSVSAHLHELP